MLETQKGIVCSWADLTALPHVCWFVLVIIGSSVSQINFDGSNLNIYRNAYRILEKLNNLNVIIGDSVDSGHITF